MEVIDLENKDKKNSMIKTDDYDISDEYLEGIVQNIYILIDKKGITLRGIAEMSGISYSALSKILNRKTRLGLRVLIKIAYALRVSPKELFPNDLNKRKTNGERFEELTKDMDVSDCNFLLEICSDYVKEWRRIKND